MSRTAVIVMIGLSLGDLLGFYFAYHFWQLRREVERIQSTVRESERTIATLTDIAEKDCTHRLVFLHHSVGKGILEEGGLRNSLLQMGIFVKGITYGDSIGQFTDMCNWLPKFQNNMQGILRFQNHPNVYYADSRTNDIVVFKSCYPNSDIEEDDSGLGNPLSSKRSLANYKAVFVALAREMQKYPYTLFIYVTSPPLVLAETTPKNADRARAFNVWLKDEFVSEYYNATGLHNFVVFDLFDILANQDNVLKLEYQKEDPYDSHPNALANREAARRFLEFFQPVWDAWQSKNSRSSAKEVDL